MAFCAHCGKWGRKPVVRLTEERHVVWGDKPSGGISGIAVVGVPAGKTICEGHWTISHEEAIEKMRRAKVEYPK